MESEIGKYSIDTPEQVSIEFDLAGMGSRFMAVLVDHLIQFVIVFVSSLLFFMLGLQLVSNWVIALFVLWVFIVEWGYFTIFETARQGQTPGKKLVKIRVIKSSGRSITVFEAMTRNFIRVIDFLPGAYLVGMISMFVDSKNRRLGDLAAGTLVVHERDEEVATLSLAALKQTSVDLAAVGYDVRNLALNDLELIETYLGRRFDLDGHARMITSQQLADMMRAKLGIDRSAAPDDEGFLENLAKTLRDTASFHLKQ